jgi:hypothetical protein
VFWSCSYPLCRSVEGGLGCGGAAATSLFLLNLFGFGPLGGVACDLFCMLLFGNFPPFNLPSGGFDVLLISDSVLVGLIVIVWLETVLLLLLLVQ